jgi:rhomboid family GlyGly-CTERM serine protease
MRAESWQVKRRLPIITLLIVFSATAVFLSRDVSSLLIFNREAILTGELWRLFTGHLVHFSGSHLLYDCIPLLVSGAILESESRRRFALLSLVAAMLVSASILLFEPRLHFYGGLSALVLVYIAALARSEIFYPRISVMILTGILLKVAAEIVTQQFVFASMTSGEILPCVTSHVAGLFIGLALGRGAREPEAPAAFHRWCKAFASGNSARPRGTSFVHPDAIVCKSSN